MNVRAPSRFPASRLAAVMSALVACTPHPAPAQDSTAAGLPPAGYGSLRQEDVSVRLSTATLQIRVFPLDERVTRLLAPDTYGSLHKLQESMASAVAEAAAQAGIHAPTLFFVTFFGLQDQARFVPDDLTITSRNRFFRPIAVLPITPRWSEQQLGQRETASAVYLYEDGIALFDPFTVSYGAATSGDWERTLPLLDREGAAVRARAGGRP